MAVPAMQSAYAEIEEGKNFDRELVSVAPDGTKTYKWTSHPERIIDYYWNGLPVYSDYRLFEDQNIIQLETANAGSVVFDKATCSYNLYDAGYVGGANTPKIKGISWTIKGKLATSSTWSSVNTINNAACSAQAVTDGSGISILGTKANGAGTFQIEIAYSPGHGIKETMRAFNNNPAWTNHHIGFTETVEVPRIIHFGNRTFDLQDHNNLVLNRTWIENNNAKLVRLTDRFVYDFGIGFDNLNDVKIIWDGTKAKLALNYLYTNQTVPYQTWFEVDPVFGWSTGTDINIYADGAGANCPANGTTTKQSPGPDNFRMGKQDTLTNVGACAFHWSEFDTTSIPDTIASISDTRFRYDVTVVTNTQNCSFYKSSYRPSTASGANLWGEAVGSPTAFVTNDNGCTTATNNKVLDLGTTADAQYLSMINAGTNWVGVIIRYNSLVRDATDYDVVSAAGTTELEITYSLSPPDPITDLTVDDYDTTSVDLSWSAPNLNSGTLQRYVLNYTTPCGIPTTALPNGTTATSYTVSGLTPNTCYSFRASAATEAGYNTNGANIVNVTTLAFNQANFTIGSFNFNANNPVIFPIRYERIDLNTTHTLVNVTFANTINLACDLRYTYAGFNHTYWPLSSIAVSSSENEASFRFINSTNEITTFHCFNMAGNQSANFVLTQTNFLLLQQIDDFRNGTFGTMGQIGAFDLITLIIVIIAMIGMNRTNEAVAGFFCLVAITVLTFFGVIQWYTAIIAGLAVIIMLAISATRKD